MPENENGRPWQGGHMSSTAINDTDSIPSHRRRVLHVVLDGYGSLVKGPGARELVILATGRAPVWSSIRRGWSVQETTARDCVAAAEIRNYDVVITGPRAGDLR